MSAAGRVVYLGARKIKLWPDDQRIQTLDEPTIKLTDFADAPHYHPNLIAKILALRDRAEKREYFFRGSCGAKIRNVNNWASVEADLIHDRAINFFKQVYAASSVYVDACWASVYEPGDYCMPHSHTRSIASVVYLLDPGDADPADATGGRFCFVDPRIAACCKLEPGRMTHLFAPELRAGTMMIFPSELVHTVTPYSGTRPRITLSWNLHTQRQAGSAATELTR